MKKVFDSVDILDRRCYDKYLLSEDILMEYAASSIYRFITKRFTKNSKILIVSGSGNNGADGIVLARLLYADYKVKLFLTSTLKTDTMAYKQYQRFQAIGGKSIDMIPKKVDIVIDAIFGSGLNRELNHKYCNLIHQLNSLKGYKISCDIPSGIQNNHSLSKEVFKADTTITMGGYKTMLFEDKVKNFVGKIKVASLGLSSQIYQKDIDDNIYLLEKKDYKPPLREAKNTHKGNFGHFAVISGEKQGASILSAIAGYRFGAGLVTIVGKTTNIPYYIMNSDKLPPNTTSIAVGMGLGKTGIDNLINNNITKVIDADMFYDLRIIDMIDDNILTPHPKEFVSLLKLTKIADIDIDTLQQNRFKYLRLFMKQYPKCVIILKGANTLIGYSHNIYINPFGTNALSKGGSGDVLSGLIGALLAQGYHIKDSAIMASLALSLSSRKIKKNYNNTPLDILDFI